MMIFDVPLALVLFLVAGIAFGSDKLKLTRQKCRVPNLLRRGRKSE
jgi:hypothetical protein